MNYYILSVFLLFSSVIYGQEDFRKQFISEYTLLSTESGQEMTIEKVEKLVSKNKLDLSFKITIYSKSFQYDGVDKNNRILMIAYLLNEEKVREIQYFNNNENLLLEKASAIYMEEWKAFSDGRKVKEDDIEIFLKSELERLEKEGINISLIQSIL